MRCAREGGRVDQVGRELAGGAFDMTPRKGETPEEFRARQRARYAAADPEYRDQRLARQRERRRQRYATDPVYREQLLKRQRERYETNPEYRQKIVEHERQRYARKRERQREI
jgi:flagellum-specific peptidoglycan hydrolase FlgJ